MMTNTKRNNTLDVARGLAIILVVLGHIIQHNLAGNSCSLIFKVVYSFHMPLFFLLSGYVSAYNKEIHSLSDLGDNVCKKTVQLYVPYLTFGLILPLILQKKEWGDCISVITNPQNGPWFLATLWMTQLIFMTVNYGKSLILKSKNNLSFNIIVEAGVYLSGLVIIMAGNRLTDGSSYFSVLYYVMFVLGRYCASYKELAFHPLVVLGSLLVFAILIPFYMQFDGNKMILVLFQLAVSLCMSISILSFCKEASSSTHFFSKRFAIIGRYSLHIYLLDYAFIVYAKECGIIDVTLLKPAWLFLLIFVIDYLVCELMILLSSIMEKNKYLNFLLFGKRFWLSIHL